VEDHATDPGDKSAVAKHQIVFAQRIGGGKLLAQLPNAPVVRDVVEEREDDAERLLHAHEAVEGPFAMELLDGLLVGYLAGEALFGYDVLAGVVAFGGAVPEEEPVVECWELVNNLRSLL